MDARKLAWFGRGCVIALLVLSALSCDDDDDDGDGDEGEDVRAQVVALSGVNEVPPVATLASGTVRALLEGDTLRVTGDFSGLESDLHQVGGAAAHVHRGAIGENGPIVFNLDVTSSDARSGSFTASQVLTAEQKADFEAGLHYVNVHTAINMGGEIRAQLSDQAPSPQRFEAALSGAEEVPPVTTTATGGVTVSRAGRTMTLVGSFENLSMPLVADASGRAHVHRAPVGQSGPIVIPLVVTPGADSRSGSFRVATELSDELQAAFDAGELYVNVHSLAHPSGEIRAQLVDEGEDVSAPTPSGSPTPQY